ncbi:LysR family transcriptional regulator [Phyllobacterium sp.]|jgi:DNA-binding transcriptional LysR family regulator|uniref:LysR family transcriptional regulator n=1 Tax=unclassified Phyllobacterium TaxID=2638441 RepID=UPI001AC531E5|nr:LysR family transcriptional regulator [uncultured Phyllobacterium sp.]MBN9137310.1 LysR family transcriptional regulator [Phyllobacterium sp.]MBQ9353024.1 LysR family transcriptional regulator [Phyllobacterium sp.]
MSWDDVRIFLAVARSGQILGAAKRLGVNHATVARRLTALENDINTKLLTRRTNGCELTHAGEEFLLSAERMEAEMLSIRSSLGDADVSISGSVRIGAPDGFGVSFLAPRLATLTARYPDLKIQLVPVPRSFSLSRREADIAITVDRPDQGRLVAKKLVDYTLCLYASRSYLAAHPAPRSIEDLAAHRLVGYVDDLVISPSLNYAPEITREWRPAFEISSAIGQVEAVKAGAGIGILHTFIAREYPDLVPVLPERTIHRSYWLAYHESVRTLRRITAVSSFISDLVNSETGRFT